ncbi:MULTISPECIES: (d)CMP kinase [Glycomyces]|uniref:Cytidylate kinase n=2 Tax=Glycomyces TaxID=58113 RepID=A0A9X3SW25_9ACTN|nr:(d)CMP kinase [Glycomyces lechevalierae]MDA1386669.1 (d)CMP kinase [Glycomyces lechevalierae]MDR7340737.1 cytidylate kinase [Glycomyces lechevalierae]
MPEQKSGPVVAIDGPSGAGKSTVAKTLATAIDAAYLDTGAMYRAATLAVLNAGVDPSQTAQVTKTVKNAKLEFGTTPEDPFTRVDGEDADLAIRGDDVTKAVSAVAGNKTVRKFLIDEQRRIIADAKAGIVVEGRDIVSVVAPDADVKVYLTADPVERAKRRAAENGADATTTAKDIERRDTADSKTTKPLEAPEGAVVIDSTTLPIVEVVAKILALLNNRDIDE